MIKTKDYLLPAYLACYLINGDIDELNGDELNEIDSFMNKNKLLNCIGIIDYEGFAPFNDLNRLGNECLVYNFEVE